MMRKALIAALALLSACTQKPADPGNPESYALQLAVTPAAGGGVQRLVLPAAALAAMQQSDAGDVRIFDASGKVISLALGHSIDGAEMHDQSIASYPIAMPGSALNRGVTVNVEQSGQSVTVDAVNQEAEAESRPMVALLLDTRKITEPVIAVQFNAVLPVGQPLEVTLDQSSDLKHWQPLASKVLFHAKSNSALDYIPLLTGVALKNQYLRLSWSLTPAAKVSEAFVSTSIKSPSPLVPMATRGARLDDPHHLRFDLPAGTPFAALRISGDPHDVLVPVVLFGRKSDEAAWHPLSATILRSSQPSELDSTGMALRQFKFEADPRGAGFSAQPRVELMALPYSIIAAFNDRGPFKLAVGNAAAPDAYFQPEVLLGGQSTNAPLPTATVANAALPIVSIVPVSSDNPYSPRKLWLWAALVAATVVLGFAAIRLLRAGADAS